MTTLFQAEGFMPPKENNSNFFDHSSSPNVVITSIEATPKVNAQDINDPLHLKNANEAFISNNPINSMAEENDNHDLQDYQNSSNIYTFEHNDLYKKLVFPTYTQDSGIIKECYHHHGIDEDHECAQIESPGEKKMPNTPITGLQYCLTSQFRVPETFHNSKTDEALQFELDNPSRSTSFAASTSSNNNLNADGTLSSVDSNSAFNENNNSTSIIHKNAALTLSNSDNNSSGVGFTLSSSNILKCTPPSSLVSRINVEVIKNENPPLQQIETFKQPNTLFNPFVYSAIGSLENINQNISASFKQKIFDASAKTSHGVTISVSSHQHLNKREKKILKDKSNKHKGMSSNRNTSNPRHLKDGKGEITDTNIKPSQSLSLIEEKMEHTSTDTRRDSTEICQVKASKHQSGRSSKRRNIKNKKVNINLEATQVVKPVELFRPSCDAYTPRMEKKDIKFKPAETRTSVKEMSTSMGSIQRPNFRDALRRVAMILLKHIVKIERRFEVGVPGLDSADLFNPAMRDAFDEDCFVTPRYKCSVVKMPMSRPGLVYGMRKIKIRHRVPTAEEIYDFGHRLFKRVQLSSECSIVCLIYIERLMEISKVPLMANTWRPIFMCGLLLASKVWQDLSSWNVEFASVYPQFSLDSINRLEVQFLKMVKWDLYISSSLYAKYYFALRSLLEKKDFRQRYNRMVGGVGNVSSSEALKIQKRSEVVKEEAILKLSRSM